MDQYRFLIDGELTAPHSTETFVTENPATGEALADVPAADERDVNEAVGAARDAFEDGWRWSSPEERTAVLRRIADLIHDNSEELIDLDVRNNGSARKTFEMDVDLATGWLEYYAGLTREIKGETMDTPGNTLNFTLREPHGVVAGIIPFNHPFMFAASKIAAALATGNSLVLKPSEYTPLSALKLGEYIAAADDIPDGVVNVVTGEGATGAMITEHDDVDMIDFQGSAPTGKKVMKTAAESVSPVTLELGGKNPSIVFPDVGLDRAIAGCVEGMSLPWQGQSCGSGSRILVHEDIHDEVASGVAARFEALRVGNPMHEGTEMGAMVSKAHYDRVLGYIEEGKAEDCDLLTGGGPAEIEGSDGYYIQPTVFDNVPPEATIAQEEIFGPVVSIIPWSDYDEMIAVANGTDYGLAASIWTDNLRTAHETSRRLDAGYVWVNQHGPHYMGTPFGGFKESGIGRLHCLEELYEHTQAKNVNVHLGNSTWNWE
jgi:betaine-aldehyde dehydrogenase